MNNGNIERQKNIEAG